MAYCRNSYGQTYYCNNSTWNNWARWLVLGVIVAAAILFFFLMSCFTARRRRKAGRKPFYGTGWAAAGPLAPNNTQQQYQQQPYGQTNYNAAPPYNANTGGSNQGYYGGQQTEMQAPQNAYRGDGNAYAPPSGPPPSKY